jgi:hypothetical protein
MALRKVDSEAIKADSALDRPAEDTRGTAIAAMIAIMITTMTNSTRLKPLKCLGLRWRAKRGSETRPFGLDMTEIPLQCR